MRGFPATIAAAILLAAAAAQAQFSAVDAPPKGSAELGAAGQAPVVVPPWVLNASPRPAVDFNFLTGQYWQQGHATTPQTALSVTRASNETCADAAGNYITVGSNIPCITNAGLAVWESRTNSIRNNTMQGAVAGTPGTLPTNWSASLSGLAQTVVGTGTQNGINYIDLNFSGTSTGTAVAVLPDNNGAISAATGQSWDGSTFAQITVNSGTPPTNLQLEVDELNNGSFLAGTQATFSIPPSLARFEAARTNNQATTNQERLQIRALVANGSAYNFTLRIGWPQLEGTSVTFAGPPIPTTSGAVTRAADLVTVKQVPAFGNAYSLSWSGNNTQTANSTQSFVGVYAGDGGNSNLIEFQRQSSCSGCITVPIRVGNAGQTGPGNIGAGAQSMKLAGSFANGAQNFVGNGTGTPFTTAAGTVLPGPTTLTNVTLGSTAFSTSFWDGTISRVAIWPNQALALSQLQSLTR